MLPLKSSAPRDVHPQLAAQVARHQLGRHRGAHVVGDDEDRRRSRPPHQLLGRVGLPGQRVDVVAGLVGEAEAEAVEGQRRASPAAAPAARASRRSWRESRAGGGAAARRPRAAARRGGGRRPPRTLPPSRQPRLSRSACPSRRTYGRRSLMDQSRFDPGRLAAIYAGGVVGALARVGLAEAVPHGAASWPWATFAVNMAGALLLGCFVARPARPSRREPRLRPPDHRHLRHPDHLRDLPARALRDGRRRQRRPRRRPTRRRRSPAACCSSAPASRSARGAFSTHAGEKAPRGEPMSAGAWIAVGLLGGRDGGRALRARRRCSPTTRRSPSRSGSSPSTCSARWSLGVVAGAALSGEALVIVAGGVTGSFTTFSTWMLDTRAPRRLRAQRPGAWLNLGLSLLAGFAAVALGHWLGAAL